MEPNWILQRAKLTPNRIGLVFHQGAWTFSQLFERSTIIAKKLFSLGLLPKDRIALYAPTSAELVHFIYGCMQAQLEIVFLNTKLSKDELVYQLEDAAVKLLIIDDKASLHTGLFEKELSFHDVMLVKESEIQLADKWDESWTATIMYTSGTTGFPKGVRQTLGNHKASAINSVLNIGMVPEDNWLCMVPIFHISGFSMLMKSILYGNTVTLHEKFDATMSASLIAEGKVTHMSVVGVTLGRIIQHMEEHTLVAHPHFKLMLAGGSSIPANYLERAEKLGLRVAQTYGMTETASQTTTLPVEDASRKLGSAGKPLFFNEISISGATTPYHEGEILIRGPHVTPGYIGRFEDKSPIQDGWLYTGDIGYLDEEGYLYVVDRRSDLIISGGENVYPAQIENVLLKHPNVLEAGVLSLIHI